jgi:hypothetical protein
MAGSELKMPLDLELSQNSSTEFKTGAAGAIPDEPISRAPARKRWRFASLHSLFDKAFPARRTYFGIRRKTFLLVALGVFIMLLALIFGLAIGLTHKKYAFPRCRYTPDR